MITDPQAQSSYDEIADHNISSVGNKPLDSIDNQRILPRQISSGALRGTQNVGYGNVKIDGSNNRLVFGSTTNSQGSKQQAVVGNLSTSANDQSFGIKVVNTSGAQILFGILPDGYLGIQLLDASGKEVMRTGYLPVTGTYGWATATPGNDLTGQV